MTSTFLKFGQTAAKRHQQLDEWRQHKEVHVYKPFRFIGFVSSLAALSFAIYALCNHSWMESTVAEISIGIWDMCYKEVQKGLIITAADIKDYCTLRDLSKLPQWQSAVIGLLLFSLALGFLASVLTTCGVCSLSLAKKVYYYHSAGEIYLVCGIAATAGLVAYPAVMAKSNSELHTFGIGYYLAWGMPLCYFISAFCMTLDDMIHSASNDCCMMCRRVDKSKQPVQL